MLTQESKVTIIEKSTNQYNINGQVVTSNKIKALVGGTSIFVFKFKDQQMDIFNKLPSKGEATVTIQFSSPAEKLRADIVAVK